MAPRYRRYVIDEHLVEPDQIVVGERVAHYPVDRVLGCEPRGGDAVAFFLEGVIEINVSVRLELGIYRHAKQAAFSVATDYAGDVHGGIPEYPAVLHDHHAPELIRHQHSPIRGRSQRGGLVHRQLRVVREAIWHLCLGDLGENRRNHQAKEQRH